MCICKPGLQNIKEAKAALLQDSLIKWRKSAGEQNFSSIRAAVVASVCAVLAAVHALSPLVCLQRNQDICCLLQSPHLLLFHTRAAVILERQSTSPKAMENLSLGWSESTRSAVFLVEGRLFRLSAWKKFYDQIIFLKSSFCNYEEEVLEVDWKPYELPLDHIDGVITSWWEVFLKSIFFFLHLTQTAQAIKV